MNSSPARRGCSVSASAVRRFAELRIERAALLPRPVLSVASGSVPGGELRAAYFFCFRHQAIQASVSKPKFWPVMAMRASWTSVRWTATGPVS